MKASPALPALPAPVARALAKLGRDLSVGRRRRRLTMELVAERAFVSRNTVARVERGDPSVSIGIYASILYVLGLAEHLGQLADPGGDPVGRALEDEQLPQRVRMPKRRAVKP